MRDPKRIDIFCDTLKQVWHKVPDLRFGQFMYNFLGDVCTQTKTDSFFIEDDKMLDYLKQYFDLK